jgi:hypothetical protein
MKYYDSWFIFALVLKFFETIYLIKFFEINKVIYLYQSYLYIISKYMSSLFLVLFLLCTIGITNYPKIQKLIRLVILVVSSTITTVSLLVFGLSQSFANLDIPYYVLNIADVLEHSQIFYVFHMATGLSLLMSILLIVFFKFHGNKQYLAIGILYFLSSLTSIPFLFGNHPSSILSIICEIVYTSSSILLYIKLIKVFSKNLHRGLQI